MGTYAVRRLLWLPFILLIVTFVTFALLRVGPGDPVQVWLGTQHQNDEVRARLRAQLGLDDPLVVQYVRYIQGVVTRLDFGESYRYRGTPVSELLAKKLPVTVQLNVAAMIIALGIGIPVGLYAALKQGTGMDNVAVVTALTLQSLPVFITAPILLLIFVLKLGLLPAGGWEGFFAPNLVMPALVMGVPGVAFVVRLVRASVLDVLGQDYIRTARAKGLPERTVRWRHILRNAMLPVVTVCGAAIPGLMSGSFIVEIYFGLPGVALFTIESFFQRDYPVLLASLIVGTALFVLANLVVDLMYSVLDPRIDLGRGNVT